MISHSVFLINGFNKRMLMQGLDEIGLTLELESDIGEYESKRGIHSSA